MPAASGIYSIDPYIPVQHTRSTEYEIRSNVYWIQYRYKQTTAVLHTKYCTVLVLGGGGARTCANISVSTADGTSTVLLHTELVLLRVLQYYSMDNCT